MVDGYATLFNCMPVDRASDSMMARPKAIHFSCLGQELSSVAWLILAITSKMGQSVARNTHRIFVFLFFVRETYFV